MFFYNYQHSKYLWVCLLQSTVPKKTEWARQGERVGKRMNIQTQKKHPSAKQKYTLTTNQAVLSRLGPDFNSASYCPFLKEAHYFPVSESLVTCFNFFRFLSFKDSQFFLVEYKHPALLLFLAFSHPGTDRDIAWVHLHSSFALGLCRHYLIQAELTVHWDCFSRVHVVSPFTAFLVINMISSWNSSLLVQSCRFAACGSLA